MKLEFKGTKGEWYLQEYTDAYTNIIRVKTDTHDGIFLGSSSQNPNPEYRANAKLIASAPDLLEALQDMVRMYEKVQPSGGWQGVYEGAVSAIEKALK